VGYTAQGTPSKAQALLAQTAPSGRNALDDCFLAIEGWFAGSTLAYATPIPLVLTSIPGNFGTWGPAGNGNYTVQLHDPAGTSPWWFIYITVAEVTEQFMLDQGVGWFSGSTQRGNAGSNGNEGTPGEALSRFLAKQYILSVGQLNLIQSQYAGDGNQWLQTTNRTNYLADTDSDISTDARIGCGILFLWYLNVQLNFSVPKIVQLGKPNLVETYQTLTGIQDDPFPVFSTLLASSFPPGTTAPATLQDNPFPLARLDFISHKNDFGKSEVTDRLTQGGTWGDDIWVQLTGFSIFTLTQNLSLLIDTPTIGGTANGFNTDGTSLVTFDKATGIRYENPDDTLSPQKIMFPYNVAFTQASLAAFPSSNPPTTLILTASMTTPTVGTLTTTMPMMFGMGADPYFMNVTDVTPANSPVTQSVQNPFYLSQDLRAFTVTPGIESRPVVGTQRFANAPTFDPNNQTFPEAYQYIQDLLVYMNKEYSDPTWVDPFSNPGSILPDQVDIYSQDSSVTPYVYGVSPDKWQNFNFALARVRLEAPAGTQVNNLRVFFRLCGTQTPDTDYNTSTYYPSYTDSSGTPVYPQSGPGLITVPFFATSNQPDLTVSATGDNPEYGPTQGVNCKNITIQTGQTSLWVYFGCFLNLYDPTVPFLRVGTHHCLLAEISFPNFLIAATNGNTPSPENCQQLAQRNLSTIFAENPGAATKLVPQTFDLRPSAVVTGTNVPPEVSRPDELLIDWGNTPAGSIASIYWPAVNVTEVITLANQLYGSNYLSQVDGRTFSIKTVVGVSWIPIPPSTGENFAGLFTIELPFTIKDGQQLNIVVNRLSTQSYTPPGPIPVPQIVHRKAAAVPAALPVSLPITTTAPIGFASNGPAVTPNPPTPPSPYDTVYWRYVVGSFSMSIPVTKAANILPIEVDTLAIMKYRLQHMPTTDRWYPVLLRYVGYLSGRVNGLGGNAGAIPGNPLGAPPSAHGAGGETGGSGGAGGGSDGGEGGNGGGRHHCCHKPPKPNVQGSCKTCDESKRVTIQGPDFRGVINIYIDSRPHEGQAVIFSGCNHPVAHAHNHCCGSENQAAPIHQCHSHTTCCREKEDTCSCQRYLQLQCSCKECTSAPEVQYHQSCSHERHKHYHEHHEKQSNELHHRCHKCGTATESKIPLSSCRPDEDTGMASGKRQHRVGWVSDCNHASRPASCSKCHAKEKEGHQNCRSCGDSGGGGGENKDDAGAGCEHAPSTTTNDDWNAPGA
jgi:hypothetical protein